MYPIKKEILPKHTSAVSLSATVTIEDQPGARLSTIHNQSVYHQEKSEKARLIYYFFKSVLYDTNNYEKLNNSIRFKSALDRYFNSLELGNNQSYFEKISVVHQSFGLVERVRSEEAVFRKIFPFNRIKPTLSEELTATYQTLYSVL